ncbi:MAG: T9SS type A sorting domain-containing protein [Bacteroidetes bacterium]|nr:T9SS type A sorting domain-containing protein [Bacteroidota bacterium]
MRKLSIIPLIAVLFLSFTYVVTNDKVDKTTSVKETKKIAENYAPSKFKKSYNDKVFSQRKSKVKGYEKMDSPDKFEEYHRLIRTRDGETKPSYPFNYRMTEFKKINNLSGISLKGVNSSRAQLPWIERGPANVGGRTRGLIVDPDDATKNTWFAGSVGGGVWKTTNAGVSWVHLTEGLPNLSTSTLAMSQSNHNVIYVGTGEGFFNIDAINGNGMFKTTDRGLTWTQLESTAWDANYSAINRLVVDPNNENIVIVATNTGIFRTTDGGTVFTKVYSSGNRVQDLRANPKNFKSLYASIEGKGVYKSKDAGLTWRAPLGDNISGGRAEIDIAPSDTSWLYASVDGATSKLFASIDEGENWIEVIESKWDDWDEDGAEGDESTWLGAQGWYDNTIAVNPYDKSEVFFGGIDLWKASITLDSSKGITSVDIGTIETKFGLVPSNLPYGSGAIGSGEDYWKEKVFEETDLVSVELRFGPGKHQNAHRFIDNSNTYQDYVDVPFEVWDVTNNKQLMASFLDVRKDGVYNLRALNGDILLINAVDYNASTPSADIAKDNGAKFKNIFAFTFRNAPGVSWDAATLPDMTVKIMVGNLPALFRETMPIVDGYLRYKGNQPDIHVDHHNLVMIPMNATTKSFRVLNSNDGGVAISDDNGVNWRETDENGYNTSQFYGVDKKPGANEYFGGMQDNGTWQSKAGENASATTLYNYRIGGDGYETAWHAADANKMIGGSQYNRLRRSTNGGETFLNANVGFDDWGSSANSPFVSKVTNSKIDPEMVFTVSSKGVWRSDNFAESWTLSPISSSWGGGGVVYSAQVAISLADPQIVWAGMYMSATGVPHISKDGGLTFTKTNLYNQVTMGRISGIDTDPIDPATAYATFSFSGAPKVLKTTDYGNSWKDITGFGTNNVSSTGFPDVATYCVLVMPYNNNIIWVGTDIGLVESTDGGASWHYANSGLPAVSVWEMKIVDDQVVVATHGRGIYSVTLPELANYKPPVMAFSPRINGKVSQGGSGLLFNASLRSVYDSTVVFINNNPVKTILSNDVKDVNVAIPFAGTGIVTVQLHSYVGGRVLKSYAYSLEVLELLAARLGYETSFSNNISDFVFDGFSAAVVSGFSNEAAHSAHPYENLKEATLVLRVPIVVASSNATFKYDDVAIIESGEPGTVFGDDEFWDYVIVEGNKGGEWIPLLDGYDARSDSKWLAAYNANASGSSSMFVNHSINLLDKFSAGDTVLIRFRLFADEFTVGWGWAIDNIAIQNHLVSVEDEILPLTYKLNQNYPNPFNPSTSIKFSVPKESKIALRVYNSLGELVTTLFDGVKTAGIHEIKWNAKVSSGVYFYRIESDNFIDTKKMVLLK